MVPGIVLTIHGTVYGVVAGPASNLAYTDVSV